MRLKRKVPLSALFIVLALSLVCSINTMAAQVYHGDGATNNGSGGWTAGSAASSDQCLNCHKSGGSATDMSAYLLTGHKNMLRKVTPGAPWAGSDGTILDPNTEALHYGSGSNYDWTNGTVTVGWCDPTSLLAGLGLAQLDPLCQFPYYTLTNPQAPAPYTPVSAANGTRNIFYLFGGWVDPTQLDAIFDAGFTGEQYPDGNYDCARCHSTGYSFDATGNEPTYNGSKISDAQFSRVPTDFNPGTGTASWMLDGVQCERCHIADDGNGNNHTASGVVANGIPSKPQNQSGTLICLQCHREENVSMGNGSTDPNSNINPVNMPTVSDGGFCSDGSTSTYAQCVATAGNTWNYAPFFDHESGPTFLNSPHARYSGNVIQNMQNSPDLTVSVDGTYSSKFSPNPADPAQNNGCMGCHNPHQSTTQGNAKPFVKKCVDCHASAQYITQTIHHPTTPGTPFDPDGTGIDINGSCTICHMSQSYHLFRISTDPSYSTFPTPAQLNDPNNPVTTGNTAPEGTYASAVWSDLDLACGQCHGGSGGPYTQVVTGAPNYAKATLAGLATNIHGPDVTTITATASGNGTISPSGAVSVALGQSQIYNIAAAAGSRIAYVAVDGVAVTPAPSSYTFSNVLVNHKIAVSFVPITYTITVTQPQNGSITPYTSSSIPQGANQTYCISAAAGYQISDVQVDGVSQGAIGSYTFTNVQGNHTISATTAQNPSYTITASANAGGSISPSGATPIIGGLSQSYTITPNSGYVVSSVVVDGKNVGAITSYSFAGVNANHTITASFANLYTITASTTSTNGTITPSGSVSVAAGGSQTFNISANSGYKINYVAVNGVSVGGAAGATNYTYTFSNVKANATIKADFVPITYTITVNQSAGGYITPYTYSGFAAGANQSYSIRPNTGYYIASVTVDGTALTQSPLPSSYTFTNIQANHTITATFAHN